MKTLIRLVSLLLIVSLPLQGALVMAQGCPHHAAMTKMHDMDMSEDNQACQHAAQQDNSGCVVLGVMACNSLPLMPELAVVLHAHPSIPTSTAYLPHSVTPQLPPPIFA